MKNLIKNLKYSPVFSFMSEEELFVLMNQFECIEILAGEYLIEQGDINSDAYVLLSGRLKIIDKNNPSLTINEISQGEVVGEIAFFLDTPRTASVKAIRDCILVKITRNNFESLIQSNPNLGLKITSRCIKRLLPQKKDYTNIIKTICIIPGQKNIDLKFFTETIAKTIGEHKKTIVLSRHHPLFQESDSVSSAQLNDIENDYDIIFYIADESYDEWTQKVIRQSDKLFFVVEPEEKEISDCIFEFCKNRSPIPSYLILLHKPSKNHLEHSIRFKKQFGVNSIFHIAEKKDYERISRYIRGKSISFVLSGGAAHGATHLGIIQAIREHQIPIDFIAGTSIGGFCAAIIANRYSYEEQLAIAKEMKPVLQHLLDFTLPLNSFAKGNALQKLLTHVFPNEICFEDLWIPCFCVATNLSNNQLVVLDTGPVWEALRCSVSLPAIFPPVIRDHELFIDGAPLNNLPVDIMKLRNGGGPIVGISVSEHISQINYCFESYAISGWKILSEKLKANPQLHLPNILEMIVNSVFSSSRSHMQRMKLLCDFYCGLEITEYSLMDFKHWEELMDIGYKKGRIWVEKEGHALILHSQK